MTVIRQVVGFLVVFGGEEHQGWLPPGAATPPRTPEETSLLDIEIDYDGSGYLLIWRSQDGKHCGDTWHHSLVEAIESAEHEFGLPREHWGHA